MLSKYNKRNIIGLIITCLCVLLLWILGEIKHQPIEKHGVFVILTTDKYLRSTYYGKLYEYYYKYKKQLFIDNNVFRDENAGVRYFVQILPSDPTRKIINNSVPHWFTLDAPPEGWKEEPTEAQMRAMVAQDSITRGLQ